MAKRKGQAAAAGTKKVAAKRVVAPSKARKGGKAAVKGVKKSKVLKKAKAVKSAAKGVRNAKAVKKAKAVKGAPKGVKKSKVVKEAPTPKAHERATGAKAPKVVKKVKAGAVPVGERRGVSRKLEPGWHALLVQGVDGPIDADRLLDGLLEMGVIGAARRDVAGAVLAGDVPRPMGPWGLVVQLKGQPWTYLVGDGLRYEWPREFAERLNCRTLFMGYDGMRGMLFGEGYEGERLLVELRVWAAAWLEDRGAEVVKEKDGLTGMTIKGERFDTEWLRRFKTGEAAQDAVARELDAYFPVLHHDSEGGKAAVYAADGARLNAGDFARIDVVTFGAAATLEPTQAAWNLSKALGAADAAAVRAALAAGADPRYLPDDDESALHVALHMGHRGGTYAAFYSRVSREQQLDVIKALLEGGAETEPKGAEPAIHEVLHWGEHLDERTIIMQLALLLDHGADPNALGTFLRSDGNTPLHVAAFEGWPAVMKFLVSRGADVRKANARGASVLQVARERYDAKVAEGASLRKLGEVYSLKKAMTSMLGEAAGALGSAMDDEARQGTEELELRRQTIAFLEAAEEGRGDLSDVVELADASWRRYAAREAARQARAKAMGLDQLLDDE